MRLGRFRLRIALAALLLPAFTAVTAIGLLLSCGDSMAADARTGRITVAIYPASRNRQTE